MDAGAAEPARVTRRAFLFDLGAAVAVIALAACTKNDAGSPSGGTTTGPGEPTRSSPGSAGPPGTATAGSGDLQWRRVIGGAGAAYALVRAGQATVVDTGQAGTEGAIGLALAELGLDWDDVADVVLTHRHSDHVGSLSAVAELAERATLSAGYGDLEAITGPHEIVGVATGDRIMDMDVIDTPGHTPGHISIFDPATAVLVAGDAINGTQEGGVTGPNQSFSEDMDQAWASAGILADLRPDVILFGHGPPASKNAADMLQEVVDQFG